MSIEVAPSYPHVGPFDREPFEDPRMAHPCKGAATACEIRVIVCPGARLQQLPQHARARHVAPLPASPAPRSHPTRSIRGTAFGLSKSERVVAGGAGVLFALVSLAAVLL